MKWTILWVIALLTAVVVTVEAGGKYDNPGDKKRGLIEASGQSAPPLGWMHVQAALTGSDSTAFSPGFVFTEGEFYTTAACSVKFTSDPELVAIGWDTDVALDVFGSYHPRAGEAVRDTTFRYIPANASFTFRGRASQMIVEGAGTGNLDGTLWGNP